MPKTTSFILGEKFDAMIATHVESGRFGSASEVVREGLRLFEERQARLDALNQAIDAGVSSGDAGGFSWEKIRAQGKKAVSEA